MAAVFERVERQLVKLAHAVSDEGLIVVDPVSTIEHARALAGSESIDRVLLDRNLGGESAAELAGWFTG